MSDLNALKLSIVTNNANISNLQTDVANKANKGFSSAAEEGNIKYENNIVYIYAGGAWRQIFPAL